MSNNHDEKRRRRSRSKNERKVYVGNIPTDELSDKDLLDFFKVFGKVLDIRVYHHYLFVQYENIEQANELIKKGQKCLTIKGHQLDILPSMDVNLRETKSSSQLNSEKKDLNKSIISDDRSLVYEPPRKRFQNEQKQSTHQSNQFIHCQILLVNHRQKNYAEEISSYLERKDIKSSIRIVDRDESLDKSVEQAQQAHCLYSIILTSFHQNQNLISFHILHKQFTEYRDMKLEDAYQIIVQDYQIYKSNRICFNSDKLPLSMLLCLLADGKQLTSNEIDRILIYLHEKKLNLTNQFQ